MHQPLRCWQARPRGGAGGDFRCRCVGLGLRPRVVGSGPPGSLPGVRKVSSSVRRIPACSGRRLWPSTPPVRAMPELSVRMTAATLPQEARGGEASRDFAARRAPPYLPPREDAALGRGADAWTARHSVRPGSRRPGRRATRTSSPRRSAMRRLWATIGHGIVNEIYWPSTGRPETRDIGFYLIGKDRWVDLKRVSRYRLSKPKPTIPLLTVVHAGDDYRLTVEFLPDPWRDVLLMRYALEGPYRLGIIAAPHLGSTGHDNTAWVGRAARSTPASPTADSCVTADVPMTDLSAGYVGASDGWQDLALHGRFTWAFARATRGNVALSASLAEPAGRRSPSASGRTRESARRWRVRRWRRATRRSAAISSTAGSAGAPASTLRRRRTPDLAEEALMSATVLKMHEDRAYPGAMVASMSTPWGNSTNTLGGYHLVWPRDARHGGLRADRRQRGRRRPAHPRPCDRGAAAGRPLVAELFSRRRSRSGPASSSTRPAFPVLLAAKLREIGGDDAAGRRRDGAPRGCRHRPQRAGERAGPLGGESRHQRLHRRHGHRGARLPPRRGSTMRRATTRSTSPTTGTSGSRSGATSSARRWPSQAGVAGYYVRIAPPHKDGGLTGRVVLRNRNGETIEASCLVALDFSWLVRLGLRKATDPRVADTIKRRRPRAQGRDAVGRRLSPLQRGRLRRIRRRPAL